MSDFVHLHVHSEYSLLDGAIRLDQLVLSDKEQDKTEHVSPLVNALKEMGMTACAITDHGNLYGVHTFVTAMRKAGLKPIIGSEFYVADDLHVKTPETMHRRDHLILLAKNQTGYKNLMKLSTISFVDGFYVKPRIDLDTLARYSEGLICCSACLAGRIPQLLLKNDFEGAKEYALRLKSMFAEGDFYIELQDHGLEEQKRILKPLVSLAREIGVKVVATNDAHYLKRTDADTQDTMMCITLQCKKTDPVGVRFSNDEFYLKSGEEMERLFDWIPEAIASTKEIADKVDGDYFVVKYKKTFIPHYENDDMNGRDAKAYLHDLAWERIHRRFDVITPEIEERLNYELGVIDRCGFNDYFLIVWDFVNDPLRYSLLFERFLSEERVSMPDFDIDFCFVRRPEVIEYVVEKYGAPNVAQIIAYSTMSAKAAVKDVARVYDVPYAAMSHPRQQHVFGGVRDALPHQSHREKGGGHRHTARGYAPTDLHARGGRGHLRRPHRGARPPLPQRQRHHHAVRQEHGGGAGAAQDGLPRAQDPHGHQRGGQVYQRGQGRGGGLRQAWV